MSHDEKPDAAIISAAINPSDGENDYFITRGGQRYAGVHLLIDLYGAAHLNDTAYIEATLMDCINASGATLLNMHLHPFDPTGVSGVAVLAESHISVHTWPEQGFAAFDVFMCGNTKPEVCADIMKAAFKPAHMKITEQLRGKVIDTADNNAASKATNHDK